MNDLISRQAAIDAVCFVCGDTECNKFDPDNKAKLYCPEPYAIMHLPSAEPKITEKLELLEFLFNVIQPNDMEQYLLMYNKRGKKTDGRSD